MCTHCGLATASMETYELVGELVDKDTLDVSYDACKKGWMSNDRFVQMTSNKDYPKRGQGPDYKSFSLRDLQQKGPEVSLVLLPRVITRRAAAALRSSSITRLAVRNNPNLLQLPATVLCSIHTLRTSES